MRSSSLLVTVMLAVVCLSGCGAAEAQRQAAMRVMAEEAQAQSKIALQNAEVAALRAESERESAIQTAADLEQLQTERDAAVASLQDARDEVDRLQSELAKAKTELENVKSKAEGEK